MQRYRYAGMLLAAVIALSASLAAQQPLKVTIDVKPGDEKVTIEPEREGMVPILIVSTPQFNAATVDADSIRVGPEGTEASIFRSMLEDVDKDGDVDRMILVRVRDMRVKCGNKIIKVTGKTVQGRSFEGSDTVTTEGC
jgi:hypothetical protein